MRTGWNVALQCRAVLLFVGLRLAAPGWLVVAVVRTRGRTRQNSRRSFDSVPRKAS